MSEQIPLFGPSELPKAVGPAPANADVSEAAGRLSRQLYLGTCSWSFPGWKDLVYDRKASQATLARHGLAAYARHPLLRTVCLDRTYYAPISAEVFASYAGQVPDGFRFVVKAHDRLTRADSPHYLDRDYARREVIAPCLEGLGDKAAVILFQFPPHSASKLEGLGGAERFADELHDFLAAFEIRTDTALAVELRTPALLTARYVEALAASGAAHAYNVHPSMPGIAEQARLAPSVRFPAVVVRWMLRRDRSYEEALEAFAPFDRIVARDEEARTGIAALCREAVARGQTAYVVVNNKAEGSAPLTLARLSEALA